MNKKCEQTKADILKAIKDTKRISISLIQKKYGIGFPLAAEIFAEEKARRNKELDFRAEFHLHTLSSAFTGFDHAAEFFKVAADRGVYAIAMTDIGSVQSYFEAYHVSKEYGIRPVYGAEFYVEDNDKVHRVITLAKNSKGIERIYDLVTLSRTKYRKENIPFLPFGELFAKREDVLIGLASCDKGIASGTDDELNQLFASFDYIEIPPVEVCSILLEEDSTEYCQDFIKRIIQIATEVGVRVIAAGDACYVDEKDAINANIVDYSRSIDPLRKKSIKEPIIEGRYFRSNQQMLDGFSFLGEAKARELVFKSPNHLILEIDWITPFEDDKQLIPLFDDADERISSLCWEQLQEKEHPEEYANRLNQELIAIKKSGCASMFLTCHLLAKKAKEDGHMIGYRGMVGSSLVAHLLGITGIDPLRPYDDCVDAKDLPSPYNQLPMEVVFGFDGERAMDIDMVFPTDYLDRIHQYFTELFGEDDVARAGTIETLPMASSGLRVQQALDKRGAKLDDTDSFARALQACSSSRRLMGQHPCGYIVLPKGHEWHEFTPLEYLVGEAKTKVTHYPWFDLSWPRQLFKFDLLGNNVLDVLERLVKETGVDIDAIKLDDPRLLAFLGGKNLEIVDNIPAYETEAAQEILSLTKPHTLLDFVKVKSLLFGVKVWDYYKDKFASGELSSSDEIVTNRDDLFLSLLSYNINREEAYLITERVRKGRGLTDEMEITLRGAGLSESFIGACNSVFYLIPKAPIIGSLREELKLAYFKLNYPELYDRVYHEVFD